MIACLLACFDDVGDGDEDDDSDGCVQSEWPRRRSIDLEHLARRIEFFFFRLPHFSGFF